MEGERGTHHIKMGRDLQRKGSYFQSLSETKGVLSLKISDGIIYLSGKEFISV